MSKYTIGHKHLYETMDRSFRSLLENDEPYGGKVILHSGDWKQILPVIQGGSRAEIVQATLKASHLWVHVQLYPLTENVRIKNSKNDDAVQYDKFLVDIGEGKIETEMGNDMIKIPDHMKSESDDVVGFVKEVFPNLKEKIRTGLENRDSIGPAWNQFVHERAIICARNQDVEEINNICLNMIDGEITECLSADRCLHKKDEVNFPVEFINQQTPNGCPQHSLKIKVGAPIILMRNLDPMNGM